jgi:uncharacterized cupredoxin-like copper-binding protein
MRATERRLMVLVGAAVLVGAGLAGCNDTATAGASVDVELADFSIAPDPSSTAAGDVSFRIDNTAQQAHEFVVMRTELAADELPTDDEGDVEEEGAPGIEVIDEVEDVAPGASEDLTVNLDPGHYVLLCNLPGHYRQGMSAEFTVEG